MKHVDPTHCCKAQRRFCWCFWCFPCDHSLHWNHGRVGDRGRRQMQCKVSLLERGSQPRRRRKSNISIQAQRCHPNASALQCTCHLQADTSKAWTNSNGSARERPAFQPGQRPTPLQWTSRSSAWQDAKPQQRGGGCDGGGRKPFSADSARASSVWSPQTRDVPGAAPQSARPLAAGPLVPACSSAACRAEGSPPWCAARPPSNTLPPLLLLLLPPLPLLPCAYTRRLMLIDLMSARPGAPPLFLLFITPSSMLLSLLCRRHHCAATHLCSCRSTLCQSVVASLLLLLRLRVSAPSHSGTMHSLTDAANAS